MPEIDRTEVVIETELETNQANDEIDKLESRLNDLQRNREVKLTFDVVSDTLRQQLQSINDQLNSLFKPGNFNPAQITSLSAYKMNLTSALEKIKPGMTPQELSNILDSAHISLDNSTISALSDNGYQKAQPRMADAATLSELRSLVNKFNSKMDRLESGKVSEEKQQELIDEVNQIEDILQNRYKLNEDNKNEGADRYNMESVIES